MQELQHIPNCGRDLPTPNSEATLDKLSSLFGASVQSCTTKILNRIPNLKSLVILMDLKPYDDDDDSNSLSGLRCIPKELQYLNILSYFVMNPDMKYEVMVPLSMFPSGLIRLELSGLGCPWIHMNDIGLLLSNLENLKLQNYAFRGPEWDIESDCFLKLLTLVIEDMDLVRLRAQHGSLPRLELLSVRHCYRLQLNWTCDPLIVTTPAIELVECNPIVVDSAKQLQPESHFTVRCHSSF